MRPVEPGRDQPGATLDLKDEFVSLNRFAKLAAAAAVGTLALSACAANEPAQPGGGGSAGGGDQLSGQLKGQGSTAQKVAQDNWIKEFQTKNSGATITYAPDGSGAGRDGFKAGGLAFAGSDRAYKAEELSAGGFAACADGTKPIDVPVYVSPIAIAYKLDGVDELKLSADTVAKIFDKKITTWDDAAIAKENPDAELPSTKIVTPTGRLPECARSAATCAMTPALSSAAPRP